MSWKGIKCQECGKALGCFNCGQLLPSLRVISEKVRDKTFFFCSSECRDKWKERHK